jgi:hypothetical protein
MTPLPQVALKISRFAAQNHLFGRQSWQQASALP